MASLLRDPRYLAWSAVAAAASLVAYGIVTAIIPNPVFGRQIPPEPFAIVVWVASSVLMGLVVGTYLAPRGPATAVVIGLGPAAAVAEGGATGGRASTGTAFGYAGSIAAFLAIGCPVCNKIALVLLGSSGALAVWAPLQPVVGAASVVLLAASLVWRLRVRSRGAACSIA